MAWEIEFTDEFSEWWGGLTEDEQESVAAIVNVLEEAGPFLGFPYSSDIKGTRCGGLRELRIQHKGRPIRVLYIFDPRRVALLLIGGDKAGRKNWYAEMIPVAERLYDEHVEALEKEKRRQT